MGMGVPSLGVPINIYSSLGIKFGFRKTLEGQHFCRICHRCATKTRGTSSQMRWRELQQALGRVKPRGDVFGCPFRWKISLRANIVTPKQAGLWLS